MTREDSRERLVKTQADPENDVFTGLATRSKIDS